MLTAASISAVTTGAVGCEDCGARKLRMERTQRDHREKKALDEDALPPNHLRQKPSLLRLEQEFQRYLHDTRVARIRDIAEPTLHVVVKVAVRVSLRARLELRVIENVKGFCPELQLGTLGDRRTLEQGHIVIVDAWTRERSPHGISDLAEWFLLVITRVEIWQSRFVSRVPVSIERSAVGRVAGLVHIRIKGAKKRVVIRFLEAYRFPCSEGRNAGKLPAGSQSFCYIPSTNEVIEGQLYRIAGDHVMRY